VTAAAFATGKFRRPPGAARLASAAVAIADNPFALFVYVGKDAWKWWRYHDRRAVPCVCLPPEDHPSAINWDCCRGRDVIVVQTGLADDPLVRETAERIALAECRTLIVAADLVHPDKNHGDLFAMPMVRLV
jgi:hypothetical protein